MPDEKYSVSGAHGTIAAQTDETYLDDRSNASDDIAKGRLNFPRGLYGRERELETLFDLYDDLIESMTRQRNEKNEDDQLLLSGGEVGNNSAKGGIPSFAGSRVVFLSGYSGMGKSALANEFVNQVQQRKQTKQNNNGSPPAAVDDDQTILYASGKYSQTASSPFSAISDMFEKLVSELGRGGNKENLCSKVQAKIKKSDLIGPNTEGNRVLRSTFPALTSLLLLRDDDANNVGSTGWFGRGNKSSISEGSPPSISAINGCTLQLLSLISSTLHHPLILFFDDLQWCDAASFDMLSHLLTSTKLQNTLCICSYRSNEVDEEHSWTKLMGYVENTRNGWVSKLDLFSLSPEAITKFIADSLNKAEADEDEQDEYYDQETKEEDYANNIDGSNKSKEGGASPVRELAEAVYVKTMGNIFFTKQALEELVRKNVLFYDVMCFEWRWVVSKVELGNFMSDDVVETIKGKMRELSFDVKHLLVVMSFIPNAIDVPIMRALMSHGIFSFDEDTIRNMLGEASDESMLIYSSDSQCYVFAHDRIRQASQEFAEEVDQEELLLHISGVLQEFAMDGGTEMEWCWYVAVDLLNTLPLEMIDAVALAGLNRQVSRMARGRGSIRKENDLLHEGLRCLTSSGKMWDEYHITLELYNLVIMSDYSVGSYDSAKESINHVLSNAKSFQDKFYAYLYQLMCNMEETSDYAQGVENGVKILNLYGFDIPAKIITNAFMVKEEMKLKMALKGRSYSCLTKLPVTNEPIFHLFDRVQKYALLTSNEKLDKMLGWKAIQYAIKRGMGRHLPVVVVSLASSLAKHGNIKTAQELGHVSLALCDKLPNDVEIRALTQYKAYIGVLPQLQSFRRCAVPLLQCHKDLKLVGGDINALFSTMLGYFESYIAAGLELGPLLETKLLLMEELCHNLSRPGFLSSFQIPRQFAINLRTRIDDPCNLQGKAFNEQEALDEINNNAYKIALRDSSSARLQLAFVFRDEDEMAQMLGRLSDYPLSDQVVARLHNRLCFTGLAIFALSERKQSDLLFKLGQSCLSYFGDLAKHGSVDAKAVYLFMLALKSPSREAFTKAIDACSEASVTHLEAMARERYAILLDQESQTELANEYITSCYWLYQDWGAHAKALQLSRQYPFLEHATRQTAKSCITASTTPSVSGKSSKTTLYSFNTTFKRRQVIFLKQ